ncbi:MAG: hypothetical protein QNJ60_17500 [Xenococcaceae cyanobacterium MO_188.B19]|nr:hypothetical protein [Xenococcaceae cyanobacterium MO_188.B19]
MKKFTLSILTTVIAFSPLSAFAQDFQTSIQQNTNSGAALGVDNLIYQDATQNHNVPAPAATQNEELAASGDGSTDTPHEVSNYYDPSYGGSSATTDSNGCTFFSAAGAPTISSCDPNW